ncbi:aldolase [Bipolaris maydis]|nr:aldolase [Bipolaris maydis]
MASTIVKDLVRVSENGATKEAQSICIRAIFDQMMASGGESTYGLSEFQAGKKNIDWDAYTWRALKEEFQEQGIMFY